MNSYIVAIMAIMFVSAFKDILLEYLNFKSMKTSVPQELSDLYENDKYEESIKYSKAKSMTNITKGVVSFVTFMAFIVFDGFLKLDDMTNVTDNIIIHGLLFTGAFMAINEIVVLPFSLYVTFRLESRFGFNNTSIKTFFSDKLKGILILVLIGGPLFASLFWFFDKFGSSAWLYGWGAMTLLSLIIMYVAPRFILPMFNKFTPLEDGSLRRRLEVMAKTVNFSISDIYVVDGSKRSTKANAFFSGIGKNKRIGLFDTLIEKYSEDEVVSILAHEIGHYKLGHTITNIIGSVIYTGIILWAINLVIFNEGLYQAFGMTGTPVYAGIFFASMLLSPVSMAITPIQAYFSRKNEYEADRFTKEIVGSGDDLISGLKKISRDSLCNLTPHPLYVFFNYSHPTLKDRIARLRSF